MNDSLISCWVITEREGTILFAHCGLGCKAGLAESCSDIASVLLYSEAWTKINDFQRPTLGPIRQFDIMTGDVIQILNINNNHWVCVSSIGYPPGHVNLMENLTKPVISKEPVFLWFMKTRNS